MRYLVTAVVAWLAAQQVECNPTRELAEWVLTAPLAPEPVLQHSRRMIINTLAVSLSASCMEPFDHLLNWIETEGALPRSSVLGRDFKTSPGLAALINGFAAHLQDYDDTHIQSKIHPTAPVLPAVLALGEITAASEQDILHAFTIGAEVASRVAMSVDPWHYDAGWHITGTAGVFGSVAASALLLGLDLQQTVYAFGIAGTQAAGIREVFGSDIKAWHPAIAARNGAQAAQLALVGLDGPEDIIGGRRGFWAVLSPDGSSEDALLSSLGSYWEIFNVGLKAYANGQVIQPVQDGVIQLRNENNILPEQVREIVLGCNPIVSELMGGYPQPVTGLQGKFSYQHCAAAALVDGAGHEAQFTDERVNDPIIVGVRNLVHANFSQSILETEAHVTIQLVDDVTLYRHIEHATGTPENPMSDEFLASKFLDLVNEVFDETQSQKLLDLLWSLGDNSSTNDLMELLTTRSPKCLQ